MKLTNKGVLLILILISATHISFCKEISLFNRRVMLSKVNSKKAFKSTKHKNKLSSLKVKRLKTTNKLVYEDWTKLKYLLLVAFGRGLCSQIQFLNDIGDFLEAILTKDFSKFASEKICDKLSDKITNNFIKQANEENKSNNDGNENESTGTDLPKKNPVPVLNEEQLETEVKELDLPTEAASFVSMLYNKFNGINVGNEQIKLNEVQNIKPVPQTSHQYAVDHIIKKLKDKNRFEDNFSLYWSIFDNNLLSKDEWYDYTIKSMVGNPFFKKFLSSEYFGIRPEFYFVYRNCLEQTILNFLKKANELIVKEQKDDGLTKIITLTKQVKVESYVYISIKIHKSTIDILKKVIEENPKGVCKKIVLEYYENKKIELAKISDLNSKNKAEIKKQEETLLTKLFVYAIEFFKEILVCTVKSILTDIVTTLISELFAMITNALGAAVLKTGWFIGKFVYYLYSAISIDDESKQEDSKIVNLKREKAEYYGKAIGALTNAIMSIISLTKRKSKRFLKRRMHKN